MFVSITTNFHFSAASKKRRPRSEAENNQRTFEDTPTTGNTTSSMDAGAKSKPNVAKCASNARSAVSSFSTSNQLSTL